MSAPMNGHDSNFLNSLEGDVEEELAEAAADLPAEDDDGVPTEAWLLDPYMPGYETGLQTLLGAIEQLEGNFPSGTQDPAPGAHDSQLGILRTGPQDDVGESLGQDLT